MRTFWILVFSLIIVAVGIFVVKDPVHVIPVAASTPASTEPYKPYTFPAVPHTPEAMAQARLLCAEAGDQGWAIAWRRERTGLTLEEALALVRKEHGMGSEVRPLERITHLAYLYPADNPSAAPEKARSRVQWFCLRDMLGDMADPPSTAPAQVATPTPPPAPPSAAKKKAQRH